MSSFDTTPDTNQETASTLPQKPIHPLTEIVQFALIALIIVIPIRMFIAQPFIVSGDSMKETFHSGEYLIIDQISYYFDDPERGDVVIFRYPKDPSKFFIKRIIGIPGDKVEVNGNSVRVTHDNQTMVLEEPYIKSMSDGGSLSETLGEREYFVMGDNRDQSSDSRVWGVLQKEKIIGRAFVRLFPFREIELFPGDYDINITS